jgi:C4-dicarboxylate transporter DctM subunit
LFIGGIIPGIILTIMLASVAIVKSLLNPKLGPPGGSYKWSQRFGALKKVWPVIVLMLSILGSIYLGIATPTEAAGFGCVVALIIGVVVYGFRMEHLRRALKEAAIINGMIVFVIIGAAFFTYVVGSSGLGKLLAEAVVKSGMAPMGFIASVMIIYLILGCFMDGMTILLLTLPIFVPVVVGLEFDMVWFGVLVVVNMQIGLITPPLGLDLYIMRNTFGIPVGELIRGVIPFLITLFVFLGILAAFPQLTLWLPNMMKG